MSRQRQTTFESVARQLAAGERDVRESAGAAAEGLHVCPTCSSVLVQPIAWEALGDLRWRLTLRCPECELSLIGLFEQRALDAFEDELVRGDHELASALFRFVEANMTEFVEHFIRALGADAIQPMDF